MYSGADITISNPTQHLERRRTGHFLLVPSWVTGAPNQRCALFLFLPEMAGLAAAPHDFG